ncbi:MAG: ATP-dependent sacrificial sulfur transferase LarE [Bacillota bacterium]
MNLDEKLKKLEEIITGYGQMIVAFSGGVDSTFLLTFAAKVFAEAGCPDNVAAMTATGPQFAADESEYAERLCDRLSISHKKLDASFILDDIKDNPADRCYHCKKQLFSMMKEKADMVGSVLADGTNLDDLDDYRPGYRAIQELGVASPLKEAGMTKEDVRNALAMTDIREASDKAGTPAFACLMTRIPFGEEITAEKLNMIYAAEDYLKGRGFTQVRVRCHETAGGYLARIEIEPNEMCELTTSGAAEIDREIRGFGFSFVTLDLGGYEKGKMNNLEG